MAGRVSGKVALITGGGSGIGRATAIVFGREGAKVAIADYNRDGGEQTVRMIKDAGGQALFIEANVAIAKQAEAMIAKTIETCGPAGLRLQQRRYRRPGGTSISRIAVRRIGGGSSR